MPSESLSTFKNPLRQDRINALACHFWALLYLLNSAWIQSKRLESWLWQQFKVEYFRITGACKKRGACCEAVQLSDAHQHIHTATDYLHLLEQQPELACFKPQYAENAKITCFNCEHLGPDKLCQNYEKRPQVCRNYPDSYFVTQDRVLPGCGYQVQAKRGKLWVKNQALKERIQAVLSASLEAS